LIIGPRYSVILTFSVSVKIPSSTYGCAVHGISSTRSETVRQTCSERVYKAIRTIQTVRLLFIFLSPSLAPPGTPRPLSVGLLRDSVSRRVISITRPNRTERVDTPNARVVVAVVVIVVLLGVLSYKWLLYVRTFVPCVRTAASVPVRTEIL
jgi:hypothetical protein